VKNESPTLVLLSGLLCDNFVWQGVENELCDEFTVKIFSFAGYDSLAAMADAVLKSTAGRFALAGHSMGGRVALEVMRLAQDRVTHLALLNIGVHPVRDSEAPGRKKLLDLASDRGIQAVADAWLPPMLGAEAKQSASLVSALKAMICRFSIEDFNGQIQALLNRSGAEELLPHIKIPTLLLCSTEDEWSPVSQHRHMHEQMPNSELLVVENAGHMVTVEQPREVAGALRALVAR